MPFRDKAIKNSPNGKGKPTGILVVGKVYGEAEMMIAAKAFQDANDYHLSHPDMTRVNG